MLSAGAQPQGAGTGDTRCLGMASDRNKRALNTGALEGVGSGGRRSFDV